MRKSGPYYATIGRIASANCRAPEASALQGSPLTARHFRQGTCYLSKWLSFLEFSEIPVRWSSACPTPLKISVVKRI